MPAPLRLFPVPKETRCAQLIPDPVAEQRQTREVTQNALGKDHLSGAEAPQRQMYGVMIVASALEMSPHREEASIPDEIQPAQLYVKAVHVLGFNVVFRLVVE